MATKGTAAAKSSSGIEERLSKLEAAIEELKKDAHPKGSSSASEVSERLDDLIRRLGKKMKF